MHMVIDSQVCFHRAFSNPVKPKRCTTGPVKPASVRNVWCQAAANDCLWLPCELCLFLSLTEDTTLLPELYKIENITNLQLPIFSHYLPHPLKPSHSFTHAIDDITVAVKKLLKL